MKEFLNKTILRLPIIAGINQAEKLGIDGTKELILELEKACNKYKLPKDIKKSMIIRGIETEHEFYGLNPRLIHKWFSAYIQAHKSELTIYENLNELEEANRIKYEKMIAEKRKLNPDYDPQSEMLQRVEEMSMVKPEFVGTASKLKEILTSKRL